MPKFEDHECLLVRQEEDVVKQFIDTGVFISCRRRFRSWCMISRSHPETSRYFKSNAACRNEEIRHLIHNYHMVHPFSMLNLYWDFYVFILFLIQFMMLPVDASYAIINSDDATVFKCVVDICQLADIIKLFFTGYYHQERSKVILDCSSISKRYLMFFFWLDIISCVNSYIFFIRAIELPRHVDIWVGALNRLKILRLGRWLTILEIFRQYMGYSSYLFKGIRVVLIFIVLSLWAFSINFIVENFLQQGSNIDVERKIFECFYDATLMLLLVSYGKRNITDALEYANAIMFLCFGFALQLFVYAQILQVWTKYASAENKHHSLHKQFKEYMKYKELPVTLRERIFSYFQFKFHKQFFKESDINNMVSPLLKQEILLHVTRNHIERVDFFRHLPENILMKVVAQLKSEIFLPGDVIISAGTIGNSMFFIYHGTVAVYTPSGKEVCHLEDGAHFGEIALILSESRVATVIAVTASELFMLRRSDFLAAIEPFPEFRDQLVAIATERLHKTILQSEQHD
ncbi:hypothetical protein NQ315_001768 [Exocentrus adspersus]|uniref:Cyclic nucleotide-binding domain-containing protein n=1 Tax=Exocentrus adspersus TaxID=1586481 RepID=A0AAV8W9E0_9CUCU|nr:hypothetical protein NQ315_001768 [Exocentrus adspersus]